MAAHHRGLHYGPGCTSNRFCVLPFPVVRLSVEVFGWMAERNCWPWGLLVPARMKPRLRHLTAPLASAAARPAASSRTDRPTS